METYVEQMVFEGFYPLRRQKKRWFQADYIRPCRTSLPFLRTARDVGIW